MRDADDLKRHRWKPIEGQHARYWLCDAGRLVGVRVSIMHQGNEYRANSSEGGHADFAPTDEIQIRLLEYMRQRFEHVSYEHVCSGVGIPHVYDFFRDREKTEEQPETTERIAMAGDRTKAIIQAALDPANFSPRCGATINTVVSIMGSEAGNLALKVLAVGGVYLAGGVAVHLQPVLKSHFLRSFGRKGRFADMMSRIPVRLMTGRVGIAGAAAYGLRRASRAKASAGLRRAS